MTSQEALNLTKALCDIAHNDVTVSLMLKLDNEEELKKVAETSKVKVYEKDDEYYCIDFLSKQVSVIYQTKKQ